MIKAIATILSFLIELINKLIPQQVQKTTNEEVAQDKQELDTEIKDKSNEETEKNITDLLT